MSQEGSTQKSSLREYTTSILIAVGLALVIRTTVVQAFYIPSGSMEDTLLVGDYLLANKFIYGAPIELPGLDEPLFRLPALRDPHQGDIVIFRSPVDPQRDLIKRCVAVGGQTVEVIDKKLYIDGEAFSDPPEAKYTDKRVYQANANPRDNFGPYTVPDAHYFMMGDNRDNSADSRYWRSVPRHLIKGKAMITYWSWESDNRGPFYSGLVSLPKVVATFVWRLPGRVRGTRLGNVIY